MATRRLKRRHHDQDGRINQRGFDGFPEILGSLHELGQAEHDDFQCAARLARADHIEIKAGEDALLGFQRGIQG
jgi:hypothetical protein